MAELDLSKRIVYHVDGMREARVRRDVIYTPRTSDRPSSPTHTLAGRRIRPVLRGLPRTVETLCPDCQAIVVGRYFVENGAVWIEKTCPEHGYVRDRAGLPPDLSLGARGTVPMAGRSDVAPRVGGAVVCGGVRVTPGDLVLADDDGIVIAPRPQLEACLERAGEIERVEAAVLRGIQGGASLIDMTNLAEHVARLRSRESSSLAITPPG